jgi:hypothetical protein
MMWAVIENVITLILACGLSSYFYVRTGSSYSFLWMLLLLNLNYIRHAARESKEK